MPLKQCRNQSSGIYQWSTHSNPAFPTETSITLTHHSFTFYSDFKSTFACISCNEREEPDNRRKQRQQQQQHQSHSNLVRGPLKVDGKKKRGKNARKMDFSPVPLICLFILLVNVVKISERFVCEVSELLLSI